MSRPAKIWTEEKLLNTRKPESVKVGDIIQEDNPQAGETFQYKILDTQVIEYCGRKYGLYLSETVFEWEQDDQDQLYYSVWTLDGRNLQHKMIEDGEWARFRVVDIVR